MKEHYTVSIVEQSYKDNWENGETEGTFQSVDLNDGHVFETPQEALRYFYNNYHGDLYGVYMIDDDETVKYDICSTAYAGRQAARSPRRWTGSAWSSTRSPTSCRLTATWPRRGPQGGATAACASRG